MTRHAWFTALGSLTLAAAFALAALPARAQDRPDGILHPIQERISYQAPVVTDVRRNGDQQDPLIERWRQLEALPQRFAVGVLDGSPDEVFGAITDVAVRPDGALLVLDALASNVRVFDRGGQHLQTFGRAGRGPGELTNPVAMALDPRNGDVLIVDAVRNVSHFRSTDNQYEFVDVWPLPAAPNDICALDGSIVVNVLPTSSGPIEMFDRLGADLDAPVRAPYTSPMPAIQRAANQGLVACSNAGFFVYASLLLGDVRLYDGDGVLRWIARLTEYRPMELIETADGGLIARTLPAGTHTFLGATTVESEAILVQVGRQTVAAHERSIPYVSIDSYMLDPDTGQGTFISGDLPRVAAVGSSYWVEVQDAPFPRLIMYGDPAGGL